MNVNQIIKAAIPNADEELCDFILWGRTAHPFGRLTARGIYKAASRLSRAANNGNQLCDLCDRIAVKGLTCETCEDKMREISEQTNAIK